MGAGRHLNIESGLLTNKNEQFTCRPALQNPSYIELASTDRLLHFLFDTILGDLTSRNVE
jgi:hypothetical protein